MRPKEMPDWRWVLTDYVPEELAYVQVELLRQILDQLADLNVKLAHKPSPEEKP